MYLNLKKKIFFTKILAKNPHMNQNLIIVFPCFHIKIDICYSVKTEPR